MSIPSTNVAPSIATNTTLPFSSRSNGIRYIYENFSQNLSVATVASSRSVMIGVDGNAYDFAEGTSLSPRNTSSAQSRHLYPSMTQAADVIHFAPAGQHILVDIEFVDPDFLRSAKRLSLALVELIRGRTDMTLLSYHCHSSSAINSDGGISCVGVLLESHVSFHTFPSFGCIMLDLFSCGDTSLLPLLSDVQQLFAISSFFVPSATRSLIDDSPTSNQMGSSNASSSTIKMLLQESSVKQPRTTWSYKRRGFRTESLSVATELPDLHWMLAMRPIDKTHVATVQTIFQRIDVYDMKNIHHRPKEQNDRVIFLDGIIQSRSIGEHAYHEALVHPVMFCHDAPKRVVIIGGGEGATLREVLKHSTIQEVIMVEIDEIMVRTSQKFLPEWSDCTFSGHASCFDDPRTTVHFEDAIAWFVNRFGYNATVNPLTDAFDVIIMDAL
jgi:S-adenosylmethionine/arginine decarboxylase-like enzyme